MDPYANEWLQFLARWLHVVAGIAWIGASFYFIALDNHLRAPADPKDEERGVGGEAWEIHGGGFYQVLKYRLAPPRLPEPLHWFKWEAYTTWLSGFALLVVLYYFNADTYLIDKSVADLSTSEAIAISIAGLVLAWVVYDALCRLLGNELVLAAVLLGLTTLAAWGASELFSGRAAYVQVGSMLGTMMAGNVFFVIIPAHWDLIRAKQAGREPDPAPALRGQAAVGAQQLSDVAGRLRNAEQSLSRDLRAQLVVADPGRLDDDRGLDPALLQPAPRGPHGLVDPGHRRARDRRGGCGDPA